MTLKLGKQPFTSDGRDLKYTAIRPKALKLPPLPAGWGRGADFKSDVPPPEGWGMMGNGPCDDDSIPTDWAARQGAGCCTISDPAHTTRMNAKDTGRADPSFSTRTVLDQYSHLSGYDLQSGQGDTGLEIRSVLQYRQQMGLGDDSGTRHKIGPYVLIDPQDWQSLREACWLFSGLVIGMSVTEAQMTQFDANEPWKYVRGSQDLGGHDVPILGHPRNGLWTVISWGRRQIVTYGVVEQQCDEVWAYIDPERYSEVTGETYNGWKDADLEQYLTMVGRTVA